MAKRKRDAAERARHPSVQQHAAPEVCRHCAPLLANEQKFHAEAFEACARALDTAHQEVRELRMRLRDAGHDCNALLDQFLKAYASDAPDEDLAEDFPDLVLDYFRRAYELGQRSQKGVTPAVTP